MAVLCDLCGMPIDGRTMTVRSRDYSGYRFEYDDYCARQVFAMLDERRRSAHGDPSTTGLHWELVPDRRWGEPAIVESRYRNRILDLCRERGIDRDELAEQLGTTRGAVGRWLLSYTITTPDREGWVPAHNMSQQAMKRLVMFFDLDRNRELFENVPTGAAPDAEFVEVA